MEVTVMTSIKLTSDGYAFHTMELKIHPDGKIYNKALKTLYSAAKKSKDPHCRTYPLSKYKNQDDCHCSTVLSEHGILLYLTTSQFNERYTIKAVVNPRKVLDPKSDYLGIAPTDSRSLEWFQDEFTALMRKYHLPAFLDEWKLTRFDLCVNIQLDKKKSAREFCRLLQKDLLPPKMKRVYFCNSESDKENSDFQRERDKHSICLANDSYELVVYDKLFQIKSESLRDKNAWDKHKLPDSILRLELRCLPDYLDKKTKGLKSSSEKIYWLAQHSRDLILEKAAKAFSGGTHYKPDAAKKIIDKSKYQKNTRKQLWWLFNRLRHPFNLMHLEKGMKKEFELKPRTVAMRLQQLEDLGINIVPLRKDFYLEQLPSLPNILERLEDDSTSIEVDSDGSIIIE